MSNVFKAIADPTRRKVLQLLRKGPMTAGELADHFDVTKPTMSAHFTVLAAADLIQAEKVGRTITYRLKMSVLEEALLGFAQAFGIEMTHGETGNEHTGETASQNPATTPVSTETEMEKP